MVEVAVEVPPAAMPEVVVEVAVVLPHTQEDLETHQHQQIPHKERMEVLDIIVIHM